MTDVFVLVALLFWVEFIRAKTAYHKARCVLQRKIYLISYLLSSGETVVTNAKHMSGDWQSGGVQSVKPGTRVADYVKAGGSDYNLAFDNCHDASRRMMEEAMKDR